MVVTSALVAGLIAAGLASAVVRYRRAGAVQRVQIRECLFAAWIAFVGFFAISILAPHEVLYAVAYVLLPLWVGLAMLRYRLYDVDVIIRRTLVRERWHGSDLWSVCITPLPNSPAVSSSAWQSPARSSTTPM